MPNAVNEWLSRYDEDQDKAILELVNLIRDVADCDGKLSELPDAMRTPGSLLALIQGVAMEHEEAVDMPARCALQIDREEVVLHRTVGVKMGGYFLDKKHLTYVARPPPPPLVRAAAAVAFAQLPCPSDPSPAAAQEIGRQ